MDKVLITGTSCGVGKATAKKFLDKGYFVIGLDWKPATIVHENYTHYVCDVSDANQLPDVKGIKYLVNNAGIVTPKADAIAVNQIGYINVIKKYGYDSALKSLMIISSTCVDKGLDNLEYCSSQGARNAMVKWCTTNFSSDERHVLCNGISLDGIVAADPEKGVEGTSMEPELYARPELMEQIRQLSILKRLATVEEIAEWVYFFTAVNTCVTGEIIRIDGELSNYSFVKYPGWDD